MGNAALAGKPPAAPGKREPMTGNAQNTESFDVIVVGGGPGGATCATLLAGKGRRVMLAEKSRFPRFQIGESLMPATYWSFQRLGMLDKLEASRFPRKQSVQFVGASGKASRPFYFFETNPHESSTTWQVPRDEFDAMMLDNAADHGVDVRQGLHVSDVLFEGTRAVGVRAKQSDGTTTELRASVVVDATGQGALLSRKLDLKQPDPRLRKASIYAHFKGAHRDEGIDEGATVIIYAPNGNGWFWYIPLPDDRVSVGVVGTPEALYGTQRGDPQAVLDREIAACPAVAERLAGATQATDAHVARDFSYRTARQAGDGWVAIGDACGFIDPIYSSGVFLALKSGEFAADAIDEGLEAGDLSADRLGAFHPKLGRGVDAIRKLVYAFYSEGFSFAKFLRANPDQKDNLVSLLVGDVFREEVHGIFTPMSRVCDLGAPEARTAATSETCTA